MKSGGNSDKEATFSKVAVEEAHQRVKKVDQKIEKLLSICAWAGTPAYSLRWGLPTHLFSKAEELPEKGLNDAACSPSPHSRVKFSDRLQLRCRSWSAGR